MKRIIIGATFIVLFLPLLIVGILDYQLSNHGVTYKSRTINLRKSEIEFVKLNINKADLNFQAAKVNLKFNIFKPSEMSIFLNSIRDNTYGLTASGVSIKTLKFYNVINCDIKKIFQKKYNITLENFKLVKNFNSVKGCFKVRNSIYASRFFNIDKEKHIKGIFFKTSDKIVFGDPVEFDFDLSVFSSYKILAKNVHVGDVPFEKMQFNLNELKDKTYRSSAGFFLNKNSNFKINGTILKFDPFSAKFKLIMENVKLFDVLFSKKNTKNKIYDAISKFFNINIDNIVKSFDFSVEKGRFKISL